MVISANKNGADAMNRLIFGSTDFGLPVVEVTLANGYEFNPELLTLGRYVLADYCEYGAKEWDRTKTHFFGKNSQEFSYKFTKQTEEWEKFDKFVTENPPVLYFKRELLEKDADNNVLPIEYPCLISPISVQSKEDYEARKIELFHYWGWSHESRRTFHGSAFIHAAKNGIAIADNINYIPGIANGPDSQRLWVTTNIPDFARQPLNTILTVNNFSKLSLSLPGCGVKCVRHAEAPVNSLMVMQEDNLSWSYPWIHGINSIKAQIGLEPRSLYGLNGSPEIEAIEAALQREDLYEIYVAGVEHIHKYRLNNYLNDYLKPQIEARI